MQLPPTPALSAYQIPSTLNHSSLPPNTAVCSCVLPPGPTILALFPKWPGNRCLQEQKGGGCGQVSSTAAEPDRLLSCSRVHGEPQRGGRYDFSYIHVTTKPFKMAPCLRPQAARNECWTWSPHLDPLWPCHCDAQMSDWDKGSEINRHDPSTPGIQGGSLTSLEYKHATVGRASEVRGHGANSREKTQELRRERKRHSEERQSAGGKSQGHVRRVGKASVAGAWRRKKGPGRTSQGPVAAARVCFTGCLGRVASRLLRGSPRQASERGGQWSR